MRVVTAILVFCLVPIQPVVAGPFSDELSRCLVKQTSDADRVLLIRWIYAAMSKHPEVSDMSAVSAGDGDQLNRELGELTTVLLTERCGDAATDAVKYDGPVAIETAFGVLGQVAMQGIMSDPAVGTYIGGLEQWLDGERLKALLPQEPASEQE